MITFSIFLQINSLSIMPSKSIHIVNDRLSSIMYIHTHTTSFEKKNFIYLAVLGLGCCSGFFLVVESRGPLFVEVGGFSRQWLLLLQSTGSRVCRLLRLWLPGSTAHAPHLRHTGLVSLQHVRSPQTRAWNHVSCIRRRILYHWATRQALPHLLYPFLCWWTLRLLTYLGYCK